MGEENKFTDFESTIQILFLNTKTLYPSLFNNKNTILVVHYKKIYVYIAVQNHCLGVTKAAVS